METQIAIYKFEISIAGTIWNSFVGRSLSLILVRRKVTALEWITVHAGWWGEIEPAVRTIDHAIINPQKVICLRKRSLCSLFMRSTFMVAACDRN